MRSCSSTCHDAEIARLRQRRLEAAHRHVGVRLDVLLQHLLVVHLVDMVAGQHDHVQRRVALDDVDVLIDGVGGAEIPDRLRNALRRRQDVEALVALWAEEVPAALQVADQAVRLVLRRHRDAANAGIERVRQGEVDDPRFAAEIDGGFGAPIGQLHQPTASPSGEHVGHGVARVGRADRGFWSWIRRGHRSLLPAGVLSFVARRHTSS